MDWVGRAEAFGRSRSACTTALQRSPSEERARSMSMDGDPQQHGAADQYASPPSRRAWRGHCGGSHRRAAAKVDEAQREAARADLFQAGGVEGDEGPAPEAESQQRPPAGDRAFVFMPWGKFRTAWDITSLCLAFMHLLALVVRQYWRFKHKGWLYADMDWPYTEHLRKLQVIIDLFLILDILVNFNTAYQERDGTIVKDPWRIAKRYASRWLIVDMACALPFDILLNEASLVHRVEMQRSFFGRLLRRSRVLELLRKAGRVRPVAVTRKYCRIALNTRRFIVTVGGFNQLLRQIKNFGMTAREAVGVVRRLRQYGLFVVLGKCIRLMRFAHKFVWSFTLVRYTIVLLVNLVDFVRVYCVQPVKKASHAVQSPVALVNRTNTWQHAHQTLFSPTRTPSAHSTHPRKFLSPPPADPANLPSSPHRGPGSVTPARKPAPSTPAAPRAAPPPRTPPHDLFAAGVWALDTGLFGLSGGVLSLRRDEGAIRLQVSDPRAEGVVRVTLSPADTGRRRGSAVQRTREIERVALGT